MNDNNLTIEVYSSGSTLLTPDDYAAGEVLNHGTFFPGGVYGDASFFVPRDPGIIGQITNGMKVKFRNGILTVYEGYISERLMVYGEASGVLYTCNGAWGHLLGGVVINKPWADTRISEDVWTIQTGASGAELAFIDRTNRMRVTPKAVSWPSGALFRVQRTVPTGCFIKRVTYAYNMQEGAQQWVWRLDDITNGVYENTISASGTGSVDETIDNPNTCTTIAFDFINGAAGAQTPAADGTIFGQSSSLVVYTETGNINSTEIAKDIIPMVSGLSANTTGIGSNTFSLVPFIAEGESAADVLTRAASYGDSSFNAWAFYCLASDLSTDDKPILYYSQWPSTSTPDYYIRLGEDNVMGDVQLGDGVQDVRNWIAVEYDSITGDTVRVTPDDDATLKDTTSIAAYGQRAETVRVQTTSVTAAKNYAKRLLAARKDPQWTVVGGIQVAGTIRNGFGGLVPVANIRAGQVIGIENFITPLAFVITQTSYDHAAQTVTINVGKPDTLAILLAQANGVTL